MREAVMQKMHEHSIDGINIFIDNDEPTMQFNNFPFVEIKKTLPEHEQKIDVEVFPGEVHKPTVTFVNQTNFGWGDISSDDEDVPDVYPRKIIPPIVEEPCKPTYNFTTPKHRPVRRLKPTPAPPPPKPEVINVPYYIPAPPPKVVKYDVPVPVAIPRALPPPKPLPCPRCPKCPKCPKYPDPPEPEPPKTIITDVNVEMPDHP